MGGGQQGGGAKEGETWDVQEAAFLYNSHLYGFTLQVVADSFNHISLAHTSTLLLSQVI